MDVRAIYAGASTAARGRHALRSMAQRPPADGPIWAVSMVKNEGDIIEETFRNLFAQGVDHLIVADNGSTEGMLELLRN